MTALDPDLVDRTLFVVTAHHEALDEPWRAYRRARLIHVGAGVLTVRTEAQRWVVPSGHAVWMAAGVLHSLSAAGPTHFDSLYVGNAGEGGDTRGRTAPLLPFSPSQTGALVIDPLVEALLTAAAEFPPSQPFDAPAERLLQVLLDRLARLRTAPLGLSWPRDPRIREIADTLSRFPAQSAVLDDLATAAGVTSRTAARLFVKETGQTFGQWRQQLRLLVALERLGLGASVTQVALDVGYQDVSSFIAVFRDAFGDTPARYFR